MTQHTNTNKLKLQDNYRLMAALENRKEWLQTATDDDIAAEMTTVLGIRITGSNIKGVRYAWGVEKLRLAKPAPATICQLESDIRSLAVGLSGILHTLGREVPADLSAIIARNTQG